MRQWRYAAPTWATGDAAAGFPPDIRHIKGSLAEYARSWGFHQVMGTKMELHQPNPRGYTNRFVEGLVRARSVGAVPGVIEDVLSDWKYAGTKEELKRAVSTPPSAQPEGAQPLSRRALRKARTEAAGAARFAAAYVLKEGIVALEKRDLGHLGQAALGLKAPEFWGGLAVFTGVAQGVTMALERKAVVEGMERRLPRVARMAVKGYVPMAAAVPALEAAMGERDAVKIARRTGMFLGLAALLDSPMMVSVRIASRMPGPGTVAGAALGVTKLAVLLWASEKIDEGIDGSAQEGTDSKRFKEMEGAE